MIIQKSTELTRQRNDVIHQKVQTCSKKENITKKLVEALKSSREEITRKESRFEEAILEIEFEKQARNITETAKADLENSYRNEQNKNDGLKRQRDEVIYHKEEICKEKTDIAKQLNEVVTENFQAPIVELESERQARPLKQLKESETVKYQTPKCKCMTINHSKEISHGAYFCLQLQFQVIHTYRCHLFRSE